MHNTLRHACISNNLNNICCICVRSEGMFCIDPQFYMKVTAFWFETALSLEATILFLTFANV